MVLPTQLMNSQSYKNSPKKHFTLNLSFNCLFSTESINASKNRIIDWITLNPINFFEVNLYQANTFIQSNIDRQCGVRIWNLGVILSGLHTTAPTLQLYRPYWQRKGSKGGYLFSDTFFEIGCLESEALISQSIHEFIHILWKKFCVEAITYFNNIS